METDENKAPVSAEPVGEVAMVEDTSADQTVEVEADSFSIYVVVPDLHPTVTYKYFVNDEEVGKQIVKDGETLLMPESPVSEDPGAVFLGWYTDKSAGQKFNGFGVVTVTETSTVNLYARFGTAYYIFYMSGTGSDARVIHTDVYAGDDTVTLSAYNPPVKTQVGFGNTGWSETPGGDVITSLNMNNQDHTLYPVIKAGYWLRFDSQGGTSVDSQFVAAGMNGTEPDAPTRAGYQFDGWYTAAEDGERYQFNSSVTEDTTLYAHWTATRVQYTVIHWWENANDDEYSYHESETLYGTAGEMTNAQGKRYPVTDQNIYGQNITRYPFTAQPIDQQEIAGDGSTIVNVYYTRAEYTLTFKGMQVLTCDKEEHKHAYDRSEKKGGIFNRYYVYYGGCYPDDGGISPICGKEEHTHNDYCYDKTNFTITAKYGERITNWPVNNGNSNWYLGRFDGTTKYLANLSKMPLDGGELEAVNDNGDEVVVPYYVEALSHDSVGADGKKAFQEGGRWFILHHNDVTKGSYDYDVSNEDRYAIEGFTCNTDLSAKNNDTYGESEFYYNRKSYNINYYNGDSVAHSDSYLYEADISGADEYIPERPDGIPADYTFAGWFKDPAGTEQFVFDGKTMPANYIIVYAYWAPVTYTVKFNLSGAPDSAIPSQILNPGEQVEKPADPVWEGYQFGGWLTEEGQPYDFHQGVTRNMTLYAQWIGTEAFHVSYYPGTGASGNAPSDLTAYAKGSQAQVRAPEGITPPENQVFLGWQVNDGEIVQPGDVIDITGDMTLVAQWGKVPEKTQITYDLNGGNYNGDTSHVVIPADINETLTVKEKPSYDGHEFLGWLIMGKNEIVQPDDEIQVDAENEENNILIAQWKVRNADLTITKEVEVLGADGQSKEPTGNPSFTIHVKVDGAAYNGTYTVDGVKPQTATNGNIALTDGQTATISLPIGSAYTVTEVKGTKPGYIYFDGEKDGTIAESGNTVTITNKFFESVPTSVSGTKTWSGSNAPEATATITLYADAVAQSNQPSWSGGTYTFANLPRYKLVGESVVEIDYTVAETGVTVTESSLSVSKTSDGKFIVYDVTEPAKDESSAFGYKVIGHWESQKNGNNFTNVWKPADNQYQKTYGFKIAKVDENGDAVTGVTATFTVTNKTTGEKVNDFMTDSVTGIATVGNLLAGTYVIEETGAPTGYVPASGTWEITISETGYELERVTYDQSSNFFVNLWNRIFGVGANDNGDYEWEDGVLTVTNEAITGTITVSKTVVDSARKTLDTSNEFTFDVLDAYGDKKDTLKVTTSKSDTTIELPYGTYTITETGKADIDNYTWSDVTYSGDGVMTQNGVTTVSVTSQDQQIQVAVENTYTRKTGTLVIEKKIPAGDWSAVPSDYSGIITATGSGAAAGTVKTLNFSDSSFTQQGGYYVFSETYHNVPTGTYTITESGAGIEHYKLTTNFGGVNESKQVTVTEGTEATVTVTNDYEIHTHDLSIEKIVSKTSNSVNAPTDAEFTFTVKLGSGSESVTVSGNSADYVENGSYTFTLKANEEAVIKGIPYGVAYEVTETNIPEGFVSNWTDNKSTGTMPDDALELSCTNTYFKSETINLTVEKIWSGSDDYQGTVTVELWKNNAATGQTRILSASNWSASFNDLPLYDGRNDGEINTYTVHETAVEDTTLENGRFIVYGDHTVANSDPEVREVLGFWTSNIPDAVSETSTLTITNTWTPAENAGTGKFTVQKYVTGTTTPLAGVKFTLSGNALNGDREELTNDAGQATFDALPAGTYTLTESVPTGYSADTTTYTIKVGDEDEEGNALVRVDEDTSTRNVFTNIWNWVVNNVTGGTKIGVDGTLTVYNTKVTGTAYSVPDAITITKTDGAEAITSDSATFTLTDENGGTHTALTNGNGVATFTFGGEDGISITDGNTVGTVPKTYTLTETDAPAGYGPKTGALGTVTVTAKTEEVLKDGKFVLKTTYTATIDGKESTEVTNTKKTTDDYRDATLTITKTDGGTEKLSGATFTLTGENSFYTATTGADGTAVFDFGKNKIPAGTYTLTETQAPTGFTKNSGSWTVVVVDDAHEEYHDSYTMADGETVVTDIFVTTHTYKVSVDSAEAITAATLDVTNTRNNYTVTVQKIVTGETDALPDNFQITNSYNDTSFTVTESKGTGTASDPYTWTMKVPYDTEIVFTEEYYTASGYTSTHTVSVNGAQAVASNTGTITVSANSNTVTFTNDYQKDFNDDQNIVNTPAFYLLKTDGTNPLPGAKFELYDSDGKKVWETTSTDQTIEVTIEKQHLGTTHGQNENEDFTFTLKEVEAPKGYTKDGTEWTVSVDHDGEVKVEKSQDGTFFYKIYTWIVDTITGTGASYDTGRKTLTVTNTRDLGTLTISKKVTGIGAEDTNAQATISNMEYTFDIQAENSIVKDVAGETFSGVLFDNSGKATVEVKNGETKTLTNLPTGSYTVTEVNPDHSPVTADSYEVDYYKLVVPQAATANVTDGDTAKATITNTYNKDTGSSQATLTIRKEIKGTLNGGEAYALNADTTKTYYFRITGTNVYGETVNEVYPVTVNANSSSGEAKFTLTYSKGNYTITEVVPNGGGYEQISTSNSSSVAIADYTWYSVTFDNATFAINDADGAEVTATNTYTRDTNDLSISKTVEGDTTYGKPDTDNKLYTFTISGPAGTGSYTADKNYNANGDEANTVTFTGGAATVYMKAGDTLSISGLPTGSYTVTENADSAKIDADQTDWTWTVDGQAKQAVIGTSDASLSFTNTYTRNTGTLVIAKEIIDSKSDGNPAEASTKTYTFTITGPAEADGRYSDIQFTNGKATVTITGKGTKTINGLPTGSYTVDEQDANISYWTWNDPKSITKTVVKNDTVTATVQNDYSQDPNSAQATLTITKNVVDENGKPLAVTKDTTYTFTIGGKDIYGNDPTTTAATVTVKKGENSGATETPVSLVYGTYTVAENAPGNDDIQWYSFNEMTYSYNAGSVSLNETAKSATVAVTNHYTRDNNSLTITKDVQGVETEDTRAWAAINANDKFAFTVEGPAIAAEKGNNGTYTATEDDETTEQVTFTVSGNKATATVHITGAGTLTIPDLPAGEYTVTEVESSAKIPYYQAPTVTGNNGTTITVSEDDPGSATIINTYDKDGTVDTGAELTIKKEVKDNATSDTITASNTYTFEITGTTVFGTEITPVQQSVSANGEATVTLPKGMYQVTEINTNGEGMKIDGYTWNEEQSVIGTTDDIDLTKADATATDTFTATNVYNRDFGSLSITKQVEGVVATDADALEAIERMVYTFKVTGPADADTRYQGEDITFIPDANGTTASVEVTIIGEDTLTLTGLPAGQYTVTEITEGKAIDLTYYTGPTVSGDNGASKRVEQTETAAQFTIVNTYTPKKDEVPGDVTAKLTITKNTEDGDGKALSVPEGESRKYYFQITGTDVYGATLDLPVQILEVPVGANTITTTEPIKLTYGDYTVTEVDADGNPITVGNVAAFTGYTWSRVSYTLDEAAYDPASGTTHAIHLNEYDSDAAVAATNVYDRDLTDLTVTKIFKDISEADVKRLKSFKLTVAGPADFNGGAAKELTLSEGTAGYAQGKGVTYTWTLENVPTGDYTVTENRKDVKLAEYNLTVKGSVNNSALDVIQANADNFVQAVKLEKGVDAAVTFQNAYTRQLGKLELAKAVVGDAEDNGKLPEGAADTKTYTFTLTGPADVMNYGENGTYKSGTVVFTLDEGGLTASATITITGEGSKTIPGLPTGTYTVTEDRTSADVEYWELAVTGEGSVDVTNNGTAEITVTNTYTREVPPVNPPEDQLTTLTITKMVKDSRGGDLTALAAGKNYYVQITGEDVYGDAPLTENVTVTGAGSVDVDLIWGDYEVTEVDANGKPIDADSAAVIDGYQWTKVEYTGNTGIKLDKETTEATVTVTNTYAPGAMDIPVVKTWSGDYSSLPNNIEVALYADGADTGLRLTLDSSDRMDATHWLGVFESTDEHPLYRYADGGKEIVYSVVETEMNGNSITGSSIGYWDITTGRTTAGVAGLTGYDDDATVLTVRNDYDLPDDDDDDDDDPTPSPSTEPTPSPSTEPTPSPSPSDEVEVPDEDTPLDDLPDEIPEDEVDIPDEDTPLSDQPDETDIFEEGVPMGDLPQTGSVGDYTAVDPAHTLGMLALAASLMAAGLLVLIGRRKDEETDQD